MRWPAPGASRTATSEPQPAGGAKPVFGADGRRAGVLVDAVRLADLDAAVALAATAAYRSRMLVSVRLPCGKLLHRAGGDVVPSGDERALSPQGVRAAARGAAPRAREAAGVGHAERRAGRADLRGSRRRRQGRHDQAHHRAAEPARSRGSSRSGTPTERERDAVVLPALRRAPPGSGRDRPLRPLLVQPRRRRARHGLLHARRSTASSCARARSSSGCSCATGSCCASTGSRSATTSRSGASSSAPKIRCERWKLSPMDLESRDRWVDYSRAKDEMLAAHAHARGTLVHRRGRRQARARADLHRRTWSARSTTRTCSPARSRCRSDPAYETTTSARHVKRTRWCCHRSVARVAIEVRLRADSVRWIGRRGFGSALPSSPRCPPSATLRASAPR